MKNRVKDLKQIHVDFMRADMRKSDIEECEATSGRFAGDVLQQALDLSEYKKVIYCNDGVPCCAFGVASQECPDSEKISGVPWMLATKDFLKAVDVIKELSTFYIEEMLSLYPYLENYVDARHERSVRWLKRCGFTIEDPKPYGVMGLPFHRFWMRKEG